MEDELFEWHSEQNFLLPWLLEQQETSLDWQGFGAYVPRHCEDLDGPRMALGSYKKPVEISALRFS